MRVLTINDFTKQTVQRVVDYAERFEHWYRPGLARRPPGDDPKHVAQLDSYRCVFSITLDRGTAYRHLSISVPSRDLPNPYTAFTIAQLFGFTGWDGKSIQSVLPAGWAVSPHKDEHCVVIAQPYEGARPMA
jgi:hypothetical protein